MPIDENKKMLLVVTFPDQLLIATSFSLTSHNRLATS
jgi:hypothetical protein